MVSPYRGRYSGLRPRAWLAHFAGSNPKCGRRPPARIHPAAVPRTGLINTSPGKRSGPQGLKPALLSVLNGTAEAVPYPKPFMRPVLLFVARCGVVTATGLDFVLSLLRFDLDFSERAVARGIGGCVTNVVLAAKFLRNLIESLAEFLNLVTNFNHAAAGFLREFFHRGIAAIAHAAIETAVRDEQHVADGIGLLRRFD